ncbi:LysE family translocator [Aquitalea magnusonii]|uniref:Arginine exporter protein ArgO n=1 Tax=Aquitalea magnusonii TaxID=332411 RepID=A0A318JZG2_9NEIS|nr:LysE family transporter [Aquitalea magnusonii]PXX46335.1 arginine exporter protein ArgO [Aquitalea magnusonii]
MHLLTLFAQALLLGLAIAAPVGPIGLLCIDRSLRQGPWVGLATGLGAATADALYATLGALGLSALIQQLTALALPLAVAGSLLLAWMGLGMLRRHAGSEAARVASAHGWYRAWASALLLTLSNPMTILSFLAVFASLSGHAQPGMAEALLMVAGVFAGSALWWCVLAFGAGRLLGRLGEAGRQRIDIVCGLLLLGMGLLLLWRALAALVG